MDRRTYLKSGAGAIASATLAGCLGLGGGDKVVIGSDIPYPPFEYR